MTYDLYGSLSTDIDKAKEVLENTLSFKFCEHNSSYHGVYFEWSEERYEESFVLKRNVDPIDDEPVETSFAEYPIIFYVNNTLRSKELQIKMALKAKEFILVRREEL